MKMVSRRSAPTTVIVALYVTVRGEFIVVGDLMKSVSLLTYKPEGWSSSERGTTTPTG